MSHMVNLEMSTARFATNIRMQRNRNKYKANELVLWRYSHTR
jgi:hypothetical protein